MLDERVEKSTDETFEAGPIARAGAGLTLTDVSGQRQHQQHHEPSTQTHR
jgi:hypothetical protein